MTCFPRRTTALRLLYAYQRRWDESLVEAKRAIALDPGYAQGLCPACRGADPCRPTGRSLGAARNGRQPRTLSLELGSYQWVSGSANFATSRYPEAITALKGCLTDDPDFLPAHIHLAAIYGELQMADEAEAELAETAGLSPGLSLRSFRRQLFPYRDPKVRRRLIEGLRKAGLPDEVPSRHRARPTLPVRGCKGLVRRAAAPLAAGDAGGVRGGLAGGRGGAGCRGRRLQARLGRSRPSAPTTRSGRTWAISTSGTDGPGPHDGARMLAAISSGSDAVRIFCL